MENVLLVPEYLHKKTLMTIFVNMLPRVDTERWMWFTKFQELHGGNLVSQVEWRVAVPEITYPTQINKVTDNSIVFL